MKIFEMNDCEWWMAETSVEALAAFRAAYGPDETAEPRALTDAEMDRLKFHDDLSDPDAAVRTFREELARREYCEPMLFATTEF